MCVGKRGNKSERRGKKRAKKARQDGRESWRWQRAGGSSPRMWVVSLSLRGASLITGLLLLHATFWDTLVD